MLKIKTAMLALATVAQFAAAQDPAETRPGNRGGHQPAFPNQTRAPNLKANVAFDIEPVVATGLAFPFGFAFLPDGRTLITERRLGQIRIAGKDGQLSAPVAGVPTVDGRGQGGLLDIVIDPAFATNGLVYWSFSEQLADMTNGTAVARGKLVETPTPHLDNVQVIYRQTPLRSTMHYGSRLVWNRDGTLFVTQGDRSVLPGRVQSQDLQSLIGKVVRINADGTIPRDNPFVGRSDAKPEIWSYGHRNVQGAFLHPTTGELWTMEHGPQGGDELNIARKGKDYGWPSITYGVEYGGAHTKIGEGGQKAGMEQPVYYWDPVIAPGAAMFYNANLFPAWKGSVFVSGLNTGYVARLTMDGDKVKGEERLTFSPTNVRYRDLDVGPDGALYVLTDGPTAQLLRVVPKK
jgi:glucose/arabinose dehydrogenase